MCSSFEINFYHVDFMPILYREKVFQNFQVIQYDGHTVTAILLRWCDVTLHKTTVPSSQE
jgi:hypothetical protein